MSVQNLPASARGKAGFYSVFMIAAMWAAVVQAQPNIIFILGDDMSAEEIWPMTQLKNTLLDHGTRFDNSFVTTSLCCPARASILRGQYAHNHGVYGNDGNNGGFNAFYNKGLEAETLGVWLQEQGYRTALIGKYLNGYGDTGNSVPATYVPPGWSEWLALSGSQKFYNYKMNENGVMVSYGTAPQDYQTDVLSGMAVNFIERASAEQRPFFLYLAPTSPHKPYTPALRHVGAFSGILPPRTPSYNEEDVSDKPAWLRAYPLLTTTSQRQIDLDYATRMEMLLAVDDMVGAIIAKLEQIGELDNTYVIFTTDNGWMKGEHRLSDGKVNAFEESIRVPLIVRGPGVAENVARSEQVLNIDFAPTFLEIAGNRNKGRSLDGRSLLPLLAATATPAWRDRILIEYLQTGRNRLDIPRFSAVRTGQYKYIEYMNTALERELYDLSLDPYELESLHASAPASVLNDLKAAVSDLASCSGARCRIADGGPLDNYPPLAVDDAASTLEDNAVEIDVLANDSDPDGDPLTVTGATAQNGSVAITAGQRLLYTPALDFNGQDSVTYTIEDPSGESGSASVSITVVAVNDAPIAEPDAALTGENTAVTIAVLANDTDPDGDALAVVSATALQGDVLINPDGTLTYTPSAAFRGTDTISYTIADPEGLVASSVVTVQVTAVNRAPVAVDDLASTLEDTQVSINVLANDYDPDGDVLTVTAASAQNGVVSISATGVLTYAPLPNYFGSDTIVYTLTDAIGATASATVTLTVVAVNDAPVAVADNSSVSKNQARIITVLANDYDVDGDALTLTQVQILSGSGTAVINPDGTLLYTPPRDVTGKRSFTYQIADGNGGVANGKVTVNIQ